MRREFLGDSYDAVKRLWQQALLDWAPLFTNPRFLPPDLREEFSRLTGIPMLPENPPERYSILNDPDTGIRLPGEVNQAESLKHISMRSILDQLQRPGLRAVITFDQSEYRLSGISRFLQRQAKMRFLVDAGRGAFYYRSHAPFLFALPDAVSSMELMERLRNFGIPECRLEKVGQIRECAP